MSALRVMDSWSGVNGAGFLGGIASNDWDFARKETLALLRQSGERIEVAVSETARRARRILVQEHNIPVEEVDPLSSDELVACIV